MGKRGRKRKWKCKFLLFWLTWRLSIFDILSSSDFVLPFSVFFLSNKLPLLEERGIERERGWGLGSFPAILVSRERVSWKKQTGGGGGKFS
ncbi:hypothetical protein Csa_009575 [Cucumis sativus]|uniref:Uncharacterized protein n=1 Tax=Cucumis sativus TaxID=3659 RepID=A0A0A0L4R3_CUCSA|nr:hypothetical protein Csa_009575 [Cucumis sativus]